MIAKVPSMQRQDRFPLFIVEVEFVIFIRNETFVVFLHFTNKRLVEKDDLLNFERKIRYLLSRIV